MYTIPIISGFIFFIAIWMSFTSVLHCSNSVINNRNENVTGNVVVASICWGALYGLSLI